VLWRIHEQATCGDGFVRRWGALPQGYLPDEAFFRHAQDVP